MRRAKRYQRSREKAESLSTLPEHLHDFASHPDFTVRIRTAGNPNAWSKTLELLSTDEDFKVRESVSKNPSTPAGVLHRLVTETTKIVETKRDPKGDWSAIPKKELEAFDELLEGVNDLKESERIKLRLNVAANPSTVLDTLELLATDTDESVRRAVADNPRTPLEVALLLDPSIKRD